MNLLAGAIVAALGLIVAVLSIAGVVPGVTQAGVVLILFGGLIIGLSFINKPSPEDTPRMPTAATLVKMFFSPSEVFQNLRQHPRWLAAALLMGIMSVTYGSLFMNRVTVERVTNYTVDKTLQMSFLNDEARQKIESSRAQTIEDAKDPVKRAGQAVSSFAVSVGGYAFLAALFFLFVMAFGGSIYYWQAFSAVIYAAFPVAVLRFVLNTTVLFLKDPTEIHPILGQSSLIQDNLSFLVSAAENPVIYVLLAGLSLLAFYWIWLQATGLKHTGERVSGSTGWTATLIVYGALLLLGVVGAFAFPSFMS